MTNPPPPWGPEHGGPSAASPPPGAPPPPDHTQPGWPPPSFPPPSRNKTSLSSRALLGIGVAILVVCCGGGGLLAVIGENAKQADLTAARASTSTEPGTTAAPAGPAPTEAPTAPAPTTPPASPPPPTTAAPAWPNVPLTKDTVEARLRSQKLEPTNVTLFGDAVIVRYKPTVWDEDATVQRAGTDGFKTARALNDHPEIGGVRTEIAADFKDQYGNTTEEIGVWSLVARETRAKINWDGIEGRVASDGSDWLCIADDKGTHPAVWKAVETRKCLPLGLD